MAIAIWSNFKSAINLYVMNINISKQPIGSKMKISKPKSFSTRVYTIIFTSLLLLNAAPSAIVQHYNDESNHLVYAHYGYLKLIATTEGNASSTDFYFNSFATRGLDPGYDASMFGGVAPAYALYSHLVENNVGTPYAIQSLAGDDMNNALIPLGLNAAEGQEIVISILQTDFPNSINVFLEDALNNSSTLLNHNDYTFTADSHLSGAGRFFLRLESNALETSESTIENLEISLDKSSESIIIRGVLNNKTTLRLFTVNSALVQEKSLDLSSKVQMVSTANLSKGIYIVELRTNNKKQTKKIIIN